MKKLLPILALVCVYSSVFSQDSILKVSLIKNISGNFRDFTTDNLGNIYLLNALNQVKKLNEKGDSVAVYNDVRKFGSIYSIDATNPLKVLVYYKDFATVTVLDRLLNARNTINLREQNIWQVRVVTSSYDNNTWLYDELESKIKKVDDNGKVLLESADFRQVFDSVPTPTAMFDRDGQLYLYDPRKGLLVFDYYGAKKNNFQMLNLHDLQVIDKNTITARIDDRVVVYKPLTLQTFSYKVFESFENLKKIQFNGTKLYCLTKNGNLEVYSVNNAR